MLEEINTINGLRSQFATLKSGIGEHRKYLPYVFTEHGVMMFAGMLKSEIVIEVSKKIICAFITMRHFINENKDIFKRLTVTEYKLLVHDDKIDKLFNLLESKKINKQKYSLTEKYMTLIV